ncbi:nitric oxide synthase oxygenase [Cyanobium sp. FGCU-6]|nr:nitric oxide synthase oxygenase [Cyanobium sp. FGCU6]
MSPTLVCADPHHPLNRLIAERLGIQAQLPGAASEGEDGPLLLLHTVSASPSRCEPGERPVLLIAPWHLDLPDGPPGAALLRHGPLLSDLGHHDQALSLQRLLLWPYGNEPLAWLAIEDLLAAIEDWLRDPWWGERWLEGPEAFTAEQTAAAISSALQTAISSAESFAALKFQASDRDGDGRLDPDELRATLLQAGVSASEAGWALELLGSTTGVDASQFHEALDPALELALAEQQASVQLVRLEPQAAVAELLLHGWSQSAATDFHQRPAAPRPAASVSLCKGRTPLAEMLRTRVVDWIPVEIVPALGVISRRAGRLEGQNALLFTYRRRDGRVDVLERSLDFRLFDLRDRDVHDSGELLTWRQGDLERSLTLVEHRVVALKVRGHWGDLHRAERLLIRGELIPAWMRVLFRRSGEFQLQQELPRAPADLVCRCARVRCDRAAQLIQQQPSLTLADLARQTKATTVCGGCIPMFESWLAAGGPMPPGAAATATGPLLSIAGSDVQPVVATSPSLQPIHDQLSEARAFLQQSYGEQNLVDVLQPRLAEVEEQLQRQGHYSHTYDELATGARLAWRNATRCLGRHLWHELDVRDRRELESEEEMFEAILDHIAAATNGGELRSTITVFKPDGRRIWNPQFCRYAGYRQSDGSILGDPMQLAFTDALLAMGWEPGERGRFDLLPIVIQRPGRSPRWFELPRELILEVPIRHPEYSWFAELDLRWYALPAVSNMAFDCGGIQYTAAPFNGFYMGTEIGARNFADLDRYNQLPLIAARLGLDTSSERSLWRDRAVVELNVAVLHSYAQAGVRMADHHTLTRSFMEFSASEHQCGRSVQVDRRYVVPPISASLTPTFHASFDGEQILKPNFFLQPDPWLSAQPQAAGGCPFHKGN